MFKILFMLLSFILGLGTTAMASTEGKITNLSFVYAVIAVISFLVLLGYCFIVKRKNGWLTLLFVSVFVVNTAYWLLAISTSLTSALWSNRIAYLGSVCLPLSMYMIIAGVCNIKQSKSAVALSLAISSVVFLIAASQGYIGVYYKSVSFEVVNGMARLKKEYGPLHFVYLAYLAGYFLSMVVTIIYATVTKKINSNKFAIFLLCAVGVNIAVWFAEQIAKFNFEYLSVSYIITEIFLLNLYTMVLDVVKEESGMVNSSGFSSPAVSDSYLEELARNVCDNIASLTPTEKKIYDMYCLNKKTKEVIDELGIKESTLKFHNSNIYGKLGVKSKKQLLECVRFINHSSVK